VDTHYILPLTPRDTTFSLRYQRNDASVIAEVFSFSAGTENGESIVTALSLTAE
jgi:hypothetical protein